MSPDESDQALRLFREALGSLRASLRRSSAQQVKGMADRDSAKTLVQSWFREIRPQLLREGFDESELLEIDDALQTLLQLSNGSNRRSSYTRELETTHSALNVVEGRREMLLGQVDVAPPPRTVLTEIESQIHRTLEALVPSAALSYMQAVIDIHDVDRISLRGTANELRSVLWDVLDRLAPDADVMAAQGFKLEKDRAKPTQKQKARYILKSRLGATARRTPEATLDLIEERVGALTRSLYDRSSISAHLETAPAEVRQLKMYVDTVLAELLEIHVQE